MNMRHYKRNRRRNLSIYQDFYTDFTARRRCLIHFLRDTTRKRGVVVGFKDDGGTVRLGWAMTDKVDEQEGLHDEKYGFKLAVERAVPFDEVDFNKVPHSIKKEFQNIYFRSRNYFKLPK